MPNPWVAALSVVLLAFTTATVEPLSFTTIVQGNQSGIEEPRQVVVRTAGEWKALWAEHAPGEPLPAVDFTKSMVLGVFAGFRNTAGFKVSITAVERESGRILVTWREDRPPADAIAAQVLTYPFHLVRLERTDSPVEFRRSGGPEGRGQ
jgi:hypothetical protein